MGDKSVLRQNGQTKRHYQRPEPCGRPAVHRQTNWEGDYGQFGDGWDCGGVDYIRAEGLKWMASERIPCPVLQGSARGNGKTLE